MKGVLLTVSLLSCLLAPTYSSLQVERFIREQLPNASNSSYHSATHSGHGPPWETCDYEADHFPHIWLVLYLNLILFLFLGLAIICDDFFVPSLEAISDKLDLSEDVAGATFMAAGSSAPELFTSVAGVGVNSDVGVGTIVGSAMFNILIIVAMSAVLAGKTLYLDWKPLCRDAFVYSISIVLLVGFSWDGQLEWYEVTILLLFYIAYILLMKVNSFIMTLLDQLTCGCCQHKTIVAPEDEGSGKDKAHERNDLEEGQTGMVKESESGGSKHKFVHSHKGELAGIAVSHPRRSTVEHISVLTQIMDIHRRESHAHGHTHPHPHPIEEESSVTPTPSSSSSYEEDEPKIKLLPFLPPIIAAPPNPDMIKLNFGILRFIIKWHLFVLSFPYVVLFTWTIPNCSRSRKWYRVAGSFCSSVLWIAALSFALVTLVAKTGCILDVDSFVMGLVVIAVGTSIPDAMSSILVARDGFGDMAVSNAIGSNVFDINLGLGLPFLIRILIDKGKAFSLLSSTQQEMYQAGLYTILPHPKFGLLLLVVVLTILVMLSIIRCRLNKITGLFLVFIYALFLGYAFTQELVCLQGVYC